MVALRLCYSIWGSIDARTWRRYRLYGPRMGPIDNFSLVPGPTERSGSRYRLNYAPHRVSRNLSLLFHASFVSRHAPTMTSARQSRDRKRLTGILSADNTCATHGAFINERRGSTSPADTPEPRLPL